MANVAFGQYYLPDALAISGHVIPWTHQTLAGNPGYTFPLSENTWHTCFTFIFLDKTPTLSIFLSFFKISFYSSNDMLKISGATTHRIMEEEGYYDSTRRHESRDQKLDHKCHKGLTFPHLVYQIHIITFLFLVAVTNRHLRRGEI